MMTLWDWLILLIPLAFVMYMAYYSNRYVRSVADFLAAGRIAGRYAICVADVANGLAVITLVAYVEAQYKTGFAMGFWNSILAPLMMVLALTGFCTYRFRETKAMSLGQFLEMRYNRPFRIFAAGLRSVSEMLANMICPAIAARFFIYFFDLPVTFQLFGFAVPTFILVVFLVLTLAIAIIWAGGTLALIITDTIQGLFCYPMLVVFTVFVLCRFSWSSEIIPVMGDRVAGESFLNPYDVHHLRDFNIFALVTLITSSVLNRASWIGAGNSSAAKTPHEQKMAGVLGTWRTGFTMIFYILIAVTIITLLNHRNFAPEARDIRLKISRKVAEEKIPQESARRQLLQRLEALPPQVHEIGLDQPLSQEKNLDTPYFDTALQSLRDSGSAAALAAGESVEDAEAKANSLFLEFRTLFNQMMMAVSMRAILPVGLLGLFCLLMVLMMLSTDDTRIFSASLTITQDCIVPVLKKPLSPAQHIAMLRWVSVGVGLFFLAGSFFMAQLDYINLFVTIMTSIWMAGAGPVMIFGLYSRFGTSAGAFASLFTGMFFSLGGIAVQRNWAESVYPWLLRNDLADAVANGLETLSAPFDPIIVWKMNPIQCPVNSMEFFFFGMVLSLLAYIAVSLVTCRKPFNLERMLHRGKYSSPDERRTAENSPQPSGNFFIRLLGITPEYSRGDKIIAWSVFLYSFVWCFCCTFLGTVIWNLFAPWPVPAWARYFLIVNLILPGIVAAVSTVWFSVGGCVDLFRLFRDLKTKVANPLDDGRVDGHVSIADKAELESIDAKKPAGPRSSD